ncbi:MAG: hypothetical protein JSW66_15780 [Phycisphaerales bacterium]|nr:MAG: hypothetical protein JSW66_15780 [Phycisphaerales bacterium]
MMKIDKIELYRVFGLLEAAIVGLPLITFWSTTVALCALGFSVLGWLGAGLAYGALRCIFGCYFVLPRLVASGFFQGEVPRVLPKGIGGWLVTVGVYSVLALVLALPLSIYSAESKWNRLNPEHLGAGDGGEAHETDKTKGPDKTAEAT